PIATGRSTPGSDPHARSAIRKAAHASASRLWAARPAKPVPVARAPTQRRQSDAVLVVERHHAIIEDFGRGDRGLTINSRHNCRKKVEFPPWPYEFDDQSRCGEWAGRRTTWRCAARPKRLDSGIQAGLVRAAVVKIVLTQIGQATPWGNLPCTS